MQLFYCDNILGDSCSFSREESHHISRVLRLTEGSTIMVTDGKGNLVRAIITGSRGDTCTADIEEKLPLTDLRNYRLHMAISPLQNSERLDWFVEKATEIGIDEITPVISRYTSQRRVNTDRLRRLTLSAMKQSLKTKLPVINNPVLFRDFIAAPHTEIRMIAWCGSRVDIISTVYKAGSDALIMIGPEGDFSPEEVADAVAAGFKTISLGKSRLRSETAGLTACHSVYFMNL